MNKLCAKCKTAPRANGSYCKSCHAAYERERRTNPDVANRARKSVRDSNAKLKREMISAYGGKCVCCGLTEIEFLTLDHVNNDRKAHIALLNTNSAGVHVYRDLRNRNWPQNDYRLMCMNCNFAIRNGALCPHQRLNGS
jgi:hypothetical protein